MPKEPRRTIINGEIRFCENCYVIQGVSNLIREGQEDVYCDASELEVKLHGVNASVLAIRHRLVGSVEHF